MGYLDPNHPVFAGWPTAEGPGVHSDEASSALEDIRDVLEDRAFDRIDERAAITEGEKAELYEPTIRSNPREIETIAPRSELFRLAFLVTGMWGPDPSFNERSLTASEMGAHRRHLPTVRENPAPVRRMTASFWERMHMLENMLVEYRKKVIQRYAHTKKARRKEQIEKARVAGKRVPAEPPIEPWIRDTDKMIAAVRFILGQEKLAESRSAIPTLFGTNGMPFGFRKKWGVLAKGNAKLKFVSYSELPMATCPGAGECGVSLDAYDPLELGQKRAKPGWCYSFKAFRQPQAFTRLFLNTLAAYADREFAIMAGTPVGESFPSGDEHNPHVYSKRVRAAIAGYDSSRRWQQYVKSIALNMTRRARANGQRVFIRLFVDGDINHEDSILSWMKACEEIGLGGRDVARTSLGHIEVYGYSKSWQQFVNADRFLGGRWPANYTVNLSSGSVYKSERYDRIRLAMESLPISRGYFEAISLRKYIPELRRQAMLFKTNKNAVVPMPSMPSAVAPKLNFDEQRIRAFVMLQGVDSVQDVIALMPDFEPPDRAVTVQQLRVAAYHHYLNRIVAEPDFGALVRREIRRDSGEVEYLDKFEEKQRERLSSILTGGRKGHEPFTQKALTDKALALVLHEVLWSYGLGGSCPLICQNCSDSPTDPDGGLHRCASKTTFKHKTIHIGLH